MVVLEVHLKDRECEDIFMSKTKMDDMTVGNPLKQIFLFAMPIFVGNVFQQVYNLVDTIVVGKFVGDEALAAVSVTGNILFFMFSLLIGLTGGVAVVISQFYGAKDMKAVKRSFSSSIYAVMGVTVIITVLGLIFARPLLVLLKTPPEIIDQSHLYLTIVFSGAVAASLYNWIASVLRALGDSITPLIFLIISSILNVVLDLVFVIVFNMGVGGVAYATVIAQFVSSILCITYALIKIPMLRLKKEEFKIDMGLVLTMLRVGLPAGIQASFIAISVMVMQSVINVYGTTVVAAYGAAVKVEQLAMQWGNSIGMAAGTFTGQNVGAGRYDRVEKGCHNAMALIALGCVVITPTIFFGAHKIMSVFTNGEEGNMIGSQYLRIMAFALVSVGILQLFQNLLRSAGDVSITMVMGLSEVGTRVLIAYWFSAKFGYTGIWWVTPITWVFAMLIGLVRYRSGKWKVKAFVHSEA